MGAGEIITIDVEKIHDLKQPRVSYVIGSSTSAEVFSLVQARAERSAGPIFVILDSDHSQAHVTRELELYAPLVTPGSSCLVQDGVIDTLPMFSNARPGPLPAIEAFLRGNRDFEIDHARCERFLITHHPKGWLKRRSSGPPPMPNP